MNNFTCKPPGKTLYCNIPSGLKTRFVMTLQKHSRSSSKWGIGFLSGAISFFYVQLLRHRGTSRRPISALPIWRTCLQFLLSPLPRFVLYKLQKQSLKPKAVGGTWRNFWVFQSTRLWWGSVRRHANSHHGRLSAVTTFVKIWDYQSKSFLTAEDLLQVPFSWL